MFLQTFAKKPRTGFGLLTGFGMFKDIRTNARIK